PHAPARLGLWLWRLPGLRIAPQGLGRLRPSVVIPGSLGGRGPESMNTDLWKMDSGLTAERRPGMTGLVGWGMSYAVKGIFYTLQGEGGLTGGPPWFCRFAGCILW